MPKETDLVCRCGSASIRMLAKHGYVECDDCGEEGYSIAYDDWLACQEDPHMIPDAYAER